MEKPEANQFLAAAIESARPFFAGRLGTPEANVLLNEIEILRFRNGRLFERLVAACRGLRTTWDENVLKQLHNNTGVFPLDESTAKEFCSAYSDAVSAMDAVGVWGMVPGENYILRKLNPSVRCFPATVLEPYFCPEKPWSSALAGKKVLVVHPFAATITGQFARREKIFPKIDVLPRFELVVLAAVQSIAGNATIYKTWFEALEWMKAEMEKLQFDVCLVGAGAYSNPLCAHAKKMGKVAIYIGGSLQILFGIKGRRWDDMSAINRFYNESWVRPSDAERPEGANKVEQGCYW